MNEHDDEVMGFQIDFTDDEVRTMYYAVEEALKAWPGTPARPADEQEKLYMLRDSFYRMILEISLEA